MSERIGGLLLDAVERIKELNAENQRLRDALKKIEKFTWCGDGPGVIGIVRDTLKEATPNG